MSLVFCSLDMNSELVKTMHRVKSLHGHIKLGKLDTEC